MSTTCLLRFADSRFCWFQFDEKRQVENLEIRTMEIGHLRQLENIRVDVSPPWNYVFFGVDNVCHRSNRISEDQVTWGGFMLCSFFDRV